ncbi:DUF1064 domain-containing protein [Paraburkholderia phymatum]|uniref:Gp72 n=1 Tax=Paraburkholderia phymatum (strain DSM 17167 / CIP 108236 / LMG 21445 / STM815) TaxID=391038 RepID=B2JD26_PARP8|nr:DUF1064 domain-containing protein [Paraburkholderia phymatum]ACC71082.1 protein of unknown function DUF1064 [Paraburkholderia phymatum STM815]
MTKRATSLRYPEGTTQVGTARVREASLATMTTAQRRIYEKTGVPPQTAAIDVDDPFDPSLIRPATPAKKPSKYRNEKCESGGIKFDSKREMMRWHDLVQMQARGEISELELQVPFILAEPVMIGGRKRPALRYVADFVYERNGEQVIEDVKGRITEGYRIKRHLMAARGLKIVEVK